MALYSSILDLIGNTPLVELGRFSPRPGVHIYAKLEGQNPTGSVKDRIAKYMIEAGERSGELKPGATILEPTSGNTGIGLAMIGQVKGYHVVCVMPEAVSEERTQLLKAFGAEIIYTPGELGSNGAIARAKEIVAENPGRYYFPYQYGNEANPRAHFETTGPEILRDLPQTTVFVAGLGTGGTLTGTGRYLKAQKPEIKVIAAAPHPGDLVQGLRALEEGFIPPVLDESVLDGKIVVDSRSSFAMAKELTLREGLFVGISAGSVVKAALKVSERLEGEQHIVCLLADGGWKYLSSNLWTTEWEDQPGDIESKIWW
ncbi:MAG: cysteine synthase family protein [Dehalococcoidia bacterium]|nr:cysteine synthase family protein [Chloroflexi bacterium CFX7]MCK6563239.1 cysteine synthase family protein [Dehalococcoidia bacterium]MCL4232805.1 cysteine synthase family protein [Dehalococcoidia bacterium]NUQ55843.1 cysteine synthase family protein [Dehalococcoidia bacterium]RIL02409.1 MAG: cysteine synthase B [bacterium]